MSLVPGPSQRASLEQATRRYQNNLTAALPYLEGRGIGQEVAARYRLGVVGEDSSNEHTKYRGRLAIPYLTRAGVATIRFRRLGDTGDAKYLSVPGDSPRLFNVPQLFRNGEHLVIAEGELDALVVAEYAGIPCVGVQGTNGWQPVFRRMIQDFTYITVVGDGDEAGAKFATELAAELEARPVVLPDHEDCNSLYVKEGIGALMDYLT